MVCAELGQGNEGTLNVISPGTPRGSRLVASTEVAELAARSPATSLAQLDDEMLAVVQHEQRRLVAELNGELVDRAGAGRLAGTDGGECSATDGVRIRQRRQFDPPHPARV